MQIKVFKAETMQDAMAQMKAELGDDAVVLHSRRYKKGGFFGFGGKVIIEITAAIESVPLADRVRGTYHSEIATEPAPTDEKTAAINFNDDLPIERPEKSSEPLLEKIPAQEDVSKSDTSTDETPPISEKPPANETISSADDENPLIEANAAVEENLPVDEQLPIDEENLPVDEQLPIDEENLPVDEQLPIDEENLPVDEQLPIDEENLPIDEQLPIDEENLPVDEQLPIDEENLPIDEQLPIGEENLPVDEQLPIDEENFQYPLIDEQTAQSFGFTPEQFAQVQALMFAQFNQMQMAQAMAQAQAQAQAQVVEMSEQMQEIRRRRAAANQAEKSKPVEREEDNEKIQRLEQELTRMRSMLTGVMERGTISAGSLSLRDALALQEVDEEILNEMSQPNIGDTSANVKSRAARITLSNYIEEHLKFSNGIKLNRHGPRIVAVLGTTGVGKTTTLAKIAAKYMLDKKIEAVLVTADTYRISAVEQLKTYSDILSLPLEIVYSPEELSAVIEKNKHRELILIDTAGGSRQSAEQMNELKNLLSVKSRIEKHLVLSATTKLTDARAMIERFSVVEPERIIVTKIDETGTLGLILNLLKDSNLMLSYFTTGQGVPEDIELANANILTDLILKKIFAE